MNKNKKPTCVCLAGMPASGKTTLAIQLSQKLGIPMFSKDSIKEDLFNRMGFESRQEKVQLGLVAMDILYYTALQCLTAGQSVILENNFEDLSLPEKTGCQMITIMFDGDTRTIYERFVKRDQSPSRHRGHVVNDRYPAVEPYRIPDPICFADFEQSIEQRGYRRFAIGTLIPVDCTDPSAISVEALSRQLTELMNS